jgi:hypothetical protein
LPADFIVPRYNPANGVSSGAVVTQTNNINVTVNAPSGDAEDIKSTLAQKLSEILSESRRTMAWNVGY